MVGSVRCVYEAAIILALTGASDDVIAVTGAFGMFNARGGVISDVQIQREKQQASDWIRSKDCEFFSDLAGTEHDHVIKLHDTLSYNYNTGKITLEEVRFAIRKLGSKL